MEKFRKLVLCLKGFGPFVSEIRYEKKEQDIELSFALQGKEIDTNNLVFKRGTASPHLTIIVTANKEQEQ